MPESAPIKGNGSLFKVTDADEYDRRTNGLLQEKFPDVYKLQKSMPPGREHPQFLALKHMMLALGKSEKIPVSGINPDDQKARMGRMFKALAARKAKDTSDTL